jgi:hypothetical protein
MMPCTSCHRVVQLADGDDGTMRRLADPAAPTGHQVIALAPLHLVPSCYEATLLWNIH